MIIIIIYKFFYLLITIKLKKSVIDPNYLHNKSVCLFIDVVVIVIF